MTIKAEIAKVQIGMFAIDGLMAETGEFGIAVPQIADLAQVNRNTAARDLKRLCGNNSKSSISFPKWKTALNRKAVNVVLLEDFHKVIRELDKRGNEAATMIVDALFGLSLQQLFCDAFGIKFEAEERQHWLLKRMATRKEFRPLTDQLKSFGFTEPQQYAKFVYLFQKRLGIESGTRDEQSLEVLVALQSAQVRLTTMMELGVSPWDALAKL